MNIRIILIIIGAIIIYCGCETIDEPSPEGTPSIPIIDLSIDSTKEIPVLRVGVGYESGDYNLSWKECNGAQKYELEESSFLWGQRVVYSGTNLSYYVGYVKSDAPISFRIRADYGAKISLWSNPIYLPK